jgi:antitoxin ParD1/3/4
MTVTLTPQTEALIRQKIESGRFNDATEVVEEAVRQMDERDRIERLRVSLATADEQIDRGEGLDWSPDLLERMILKANENARAGKPVRDDVKP